MNRRKFLQKGVMGFLAAMAFSNPILASGNRRRPVLPNTKPDPSSWRDNELNIAWIGHATVLINFYGKIILTDPVLFERVGLYIFGFTFGPSRYTYPALTIDEIPKPDLILLSHAHMDHMDYATLSELTKKYPSELDCITAYNTSDVIKDLKWNSLKEIDWDESTDYNGVKITAQEVKHFGWRYPWERDRSKGYMIDGRSYNAYLLQYKEKNILFGGDTAFTKKFDEMDKLKIDVAIMPIGAYRPWKWNHCNPEEALIMAEYYLSADYFIPIHCKTFKQGTEPLDEPLRWLKESAPNYKLLVGLNDIGQTFNLQQT